MLEFRLDTRLGVPTYLQLVRQVRQALRLGILRPGDQLPTAREVVGKLAINPNTVLKAYRELERDGLVRARPGLGTFIAEDIPGPAGDDFKTLRRALLRWLRDAGAAGLDDEAVDALLAEARDQLDAGAVA